MLRASGTSLQIVCNGCREDFDSYSEESQLVEDAIMMGWKVVGERHVCPRCQGIVPPSLRRRAAEQGSALPLD